MSISLRQFRRVLLASQTTSQQEDEFLQHFPQTATLEMLTVGRKSPTFATLSGGWHNMARSQWRREGVCRRGKRLCCRPHPRN